jgi:general secretion pathway protein H
MTKLPSRDGCEGSTLFELLVVLAIITLAVALAAPRLDRSAPKANLSMRAQEIAALIRYARTLAIRNNRDAEIVVDLKRRTIQLDGAGRPIEWPETVALKVLTARGLLAEGTATVVLTPQGGSTGGSIELRDEKIAAAIAISWLTGDVRMSIGRSE